MEVRCRSCCVLWWNLVVTFPFTGHSKRLGTANCKAWAHFIAPHKSHWRLPADERDIDPASPYFVVGVKCAKALQIGHRGYVICTT